MFFLNNETNNSRLTWATNQKISECQNQNFGVTLIYASGNTSIHVGGVEVKSVEHVRDLGVILDDHAQEQTNKRWLKIVLSCRSNSLEWSVTRTAFNSKHCMFPEKAENISFYSEL